MEASPLGEVLGVSFVLLSCQDAWSSVGGRILNRRQATLA